MERLQRAFFAREQRFPAYRLARRRSREGAFTLSSIPTLATGTQLGALTWIRGARELVFTTPKSPAERVTVLDDLNTGHEKNLAAVRAGIRVVSRDIRNRADCVSVARGVAVVFHQAALGSVLRSMKDPATTIDVNVRGTATLFGACRDAGVRRVVYASSSLVYGASATPPKREGEEGRPLSPYALSKRVNEQLADVFGRCFGMETIGLHYFNVDKPRQDPAGSNAAVIPRFFLALRSGKAPGILGDGSQTRDCTFASGVVRESLTAAGAAQQATNKAYNVARGKGASVNAIAAAIRLACGGGPDPTYSVPRPGDVLHSTADPSAARMALGFVPQIDLETGIAQTNAAFESSAGRT